MSNSPLTAKDVSSLELLHVFIKETPTAIAMFDRAMNYIATSQRWCDDYKLVGETLEGRNHYEIFPEIPEHWREVHRRCLDGASEEHTGELFERADGTKQWIAWKVTPWKLHDSEPQVEGLIIFSEDRTSLYEANEKQSAMQIALEVAELNQQVLSKTNRAKDTFLANLSHELRNPLNAISGWIQLMKRGSLTEEKARGALSVIEQNVWQLHALITNTLDINRIDSDKLKVRLYETPLDTILTTAISNITPKAIEKNITLSSPSLPTTVSILADKTLIEQALSNILSNAIKFTPPDGSVSLEVRYNDQGIDIIIADTGEGIPSTMLTTIFDRYVQVELHNKSHHQSGLGLGLTIAKYIIELHGGTIEATSLGIGKGSTFTIKLPQKPK